MRQGVEAGKLSFTLRGRKLQGSWTLVRTNRSPKDWLLIKHQDEYATAEREVLEEGRSALSGVTVEELKAGASVPRRDGPVGVPAAFPDRMKPMMARLADGAFTHAEWLFEPKLDGIRIMAYLQRGQVTLRTRCDGGVPVAGGLAAGAAA